MVTNIVETAFSEDMTTRELEMQYDNISTAIEAINKSITDNPVQSSAKTEMLRRKMDLLKDLSKLKSTISQLLKTRSKPKLRAGDWVRWQHTVNIPAII